MHVVELELQNIRCYVKARISLSPTINVVVGENNSGKSTLLRSIAMIQSRPLGADAIRHGATEASIRVRLAKLDPNRFHANHRANIAQLHTVDISQRFLPPNSAEEPSINLQQFGMHSFHTFENARPRNFIETYFSSRTSGSFSETVSLSVANIVGGDRTSIVAKIDTCITSHSLRTPFLDACIAVVGFPISTWSANNGKMAGLEIDAVKQHYIPLDHLGSGVAQAVGLIANLLVTREKVFLIEELENDLHPSALRALLGLVERSAAEGKNQFVVSTHSSTVLRQLGGLAGAKVIQVRREAGQYLLSSAEEVPASSDVRQQLLRTLGYELMDVELWSAWLILEESSAESVIREFLIPFFAPKLVGRLRTIAAQGVNDIEPRFIELHRLFLFIHLEPMYKERAWVIGDGDAAGLEAISKLRNAFSEWPKEHFQNFSKANFEAYYPKEFRNDADIALNIANKDAQRVAKRILCQRVIGWLREDAHRAKQALAESANDVIVRLQALEGTVASSA